MKSNVSIIALALLCGVAVFCSCADNEKELQTRAEELCKYIPDHELLPEAKEHMTSELYDALEESFALALEEPMDYDWVYYFVSGNGGSIPQFTVLSVEKKSDAEASAEVSVQQLWDDGILDEDTTMLHLEMQKIDGRWLLSDFDGRKQECQNFNRAARRDILVKHAMDSYLTKEIGAHYQPGDVSITYYVVINVDDNDSTDVRMYGDYWVYNYNIVGDTLKTVSGGNHPGCMHICRNGDDVRVTSMDQVEDGAGNQASAQRIFGADYNAFEMIQSDSESLEELRREEISRYVKLHKLAVSYYQDFGWDAVPIEYGEECQ